MEPLLVLDQLKAGGVLMADAGANLRIKYGLRSDPSSTSIARWAQLARSYINSGQKPEDAGHLAAKLVFPDYKTHVYASEADTIEALLRAAEGK